MVHLHIGEPWRGLKYQTPKVNTLLNNSEGGSLDNLLSFISYKEGKNKISREPLQITTSSTFANKKLGANEERDIS